MSFVARIAGAGGPTASSAQDPDTILSGNQLSWHRWDLGLSFSSGSEVSGWDDQTTDGFVIDLAPASSTFAPTQFASGGLNGNGYVRFLNSNFHDSVYLTGSGLTPSNALPHAYMIFRHHISPTTDRYILTIGNPANSAPNDNYMQVRAVSTGYRIDVFTPDGNFNTTIATSHDTNWHLLELWLDGAGNLQFSLDNGGVTGSVAYTNTFDISGTSGFAIASALPGSNTATTGDIDVGDCVISQSTVSGPVQANLISYYNTYWGLSL